jgi:hypothetical protein
MRVRRRSWMIGLLVAMTLMVVVLGVQFVPRPARAAQGDTNPGAAGDNAADAAPLSPQIDCTDPPTGERVRLVDDAEIAVAYSGSNYGLWYSELNQVRETDRLKWLYDVDCEPSLDSGCKTISWPAIAMARDGEDRDRPVLAFRDSNQRVAATVLTSDGSEFASHWYSSLSGDQGSDVRWIDIAAGNLDGYYIPNAPSQDEEVVIAFSDDDEDLRVIVLDPENLTPNYRLAETAVNTDGRGNVKYAAVATGDLDGDGYNSEIVVAFKDGDGHLQVNILHMSSGSDYLTHLWSKRWTDNDRANIAQDEWEHPNGSPVDVATGDIDGDWQDEVVVVFRDGWMSEGVDPLLDGNVQILVLDYTGTNWLDWSFDDSVWTQWDPRIWDLSGHQWPASVSVAVADLDGDAAGEIAVGYTLATREAFFPNVRSWQWYHGLLTYKYDGGELVQRDAWVSAQIGESNNPSADAYSLALAAADSNRDGIAELVTAFRDTDFELHVQIMDAAAEITPIDEFQSSFGGDENVRQVALAMGDTDLNAMYGDYKGECYESQQTYISAVIHSPPYWREDETSYDNSEAGFGSSVATGGGTGRTSETQIGGSVTMKAIFHEIGPSWTYEWEKSTAHEQVELTTTFDGSEVETLPPHIFHENAFMDGVGYVTCPRWCYEYTNSVDNSDMTVCLPGPGSECAYAQASLDRWYAELSRPRAEGGVGESWVPVGTNFARARPAWQSSTALGGVASRAVDGNTDGNYAHDSVTQTAPGQPKPAWQVDLGRVATIQAVQLWNRTDCCGERLADFYIFVSEEPFSTANPEALANDPQVWHYFHPGPADPLTTAVWSDFNRPGAEALEEGTAVTGRYVRVQLTGTEVLSLAEVQVWGVVTDVDQWPVENPGPTAGDSEFTIKLRDNSLQTVDGQFITSRQGFIEVGPDGAPSFNLGTETEWEEMTETSSSNKLEASMEIIFVEGAFTVGAKEATSLITTWSSETEFSGKTGLVQHWPSYRYAPYIWLQEARSVAGVPQSFLVLDYWVPWIADEVGAAGASVPAAESGPTPLAPLVSSPSHPDPEAWYDSNAATFTWEQPAGDPATVTGYHWFLGRSPDTVPPPSSMGQIRSQTYEKLEDGLWTLYVRAQGDGGQWSEPTTRVVRIDAHPPQVRLALEPALPTGHGNWYNTPVTVTVTATDAAGPDLPEGAGLAALEVSTDGLAWQPYAGPLTFDADTPGTAVWARASDVAGHVSEPVTATFKIDLTPPSSRTPDGPMPGALYAGILVDPMGNEHPVVAGRIDDALSGQLGIDLEVDGQIWTSASALGSWYPFPKHPDVEVTWYYTGTMELGRGNHIYRGQARDQAGNAEESYELARLLWFPQSAPDLEGSIMGDWPEKVRPGDVVYVVIGMRNTGYQEAYVEVSDLLPVGLTLLESLLPNDVEYDPETRTLTWPVRLLWPGDWRPFHFRAQVDEGVGDVDLVNQATAHAFWPNTDELPPDDRQRFEELERTVELAATVTVEPDLPPGVDVTSPLAELHILSGEVVTDPQVELLIRTVADTRWMYLREWALDPGSGEWVVAQDSGWLPYRQTYTWTLSAGAGVRVVGAWVADGAGNVSRMWELSTAYTNLMGGTQSLADGQRHQYRLQMDRGNLALYNLLALQGDPDLYVWNPRQAMWPNQAAEQDQLADVVGFWAQETGVYLFEVLARGDSRYELFPALPGGEGMGALEQAQADDKERPAHPLTVSDPLGAGAVGAPPALDLVTLYLPLVYR